MKDVIQDRVPIACTLSAADLQDRSVAWRRLLTESLVSTERVPGGIRLSVHPGSAEALSMLVEAERDCCPWINSTLSDASVTMTAAGDGEAALVQMFSEVTNPV